MCLNHVLFIVNSVYQLFNAVYIKDSLLQDKSADIILTDVTPSLKEYKTKLVETALFSRVLIAASKELNSKYSVGTQKEISEGFSKADLLLKWVLDDELAQYSQVYFSNFDTFTRMLACILYGQKTEFIWVEDGFSTYVIDFLKEDRAAVNKNEKGNIIRQMVCRALLYEPGLCFRKDKIPNCQIPKIDKNDSRLKELLNCIFSYTKPEKNYPFIFLEQSFRAENLKNNDLMLMEECQKAAGIENFVIKPHPRNTENIPFLMGLSRKFGCSAPWELFLLNEDPKKISVITVCSNAALTGRILFGMDIHTIMLYKLFEGRVLWKEDEILKKYLLKFARQYAGNNYYVPDTIYELRNIIRYLGECHG